MQDYRLNKILDQWAEWPSPTAGQESLELRPEVLNVFLHGENHQVYLLQAGEKRLVLKLFEEPQKHSLEIQRWAAELGIAPHVLFTNHENNYALMLYCEQGYCRDYQALGGSLAKLHAGGSSWITGNPKRLNIDDTHQHYLEVAGEQACQLHEQLRPALEPFLTDSTPVCVCHNDLVKENCLNHVGKAMFIDWDYAQLNNPWFDLASIFYYFALSSDEQRSLLQNYDPEYIPLLNTPIYWSALCTVVWTDVLWQLAKHGSSAWAEQAEKIRGLHSFADNM